MLRRSWERLTPAQKRYRKRLVKAWRRNQVRKNFGRMVEQQQAKAEAKRVKHR